MLFCGHYYSPLSSIAVAYRASINMASLPGRMVNSTRTVPTPTPVFPASSVPRRWGDRMAISGGWHEGVCLLAVSANGGGRGEGGA